jgi:hypothetical protein
VCIEMKYFEPKLYNNKKNLVLDMACLKIVEFFNTFLLGGNSAGIVMHCTQLLLLLLNYSVDQSNCD